MLLQRHQKATPTIQKLLENNPIGTPGKSMVYQHGRIAEKLMHLPQPNFLTIERNRRLIGTCCLVERTIDDERYYYIRYFAFDIRRRVAFNSGKFAVGNSTIKNEIKSVLDGKALSMKPGIHYAYIDPENERSRVICEGFGFEQVRKFTSILYSRIKPKFRLKVQRATPEEQGIILKRLEEFYSSYKFFSAENIFFEDSYFVYKVDGKIVAGIQATSENWKIHDLPGLGNFYLKYLSRLPLLNRLIAKEFRFLAIEGIFYEEGYQHAIEQMIESLLAQTGRNVAMMVADISSPIFQTVKNFDLGIIARLHQPKINSVIARTNQPEVLQQLKKQPAYLSTLDLT